MANKSVVLPHSGVKIQVSDAFDKGRISDFLNDILEGDIQIEKYRDNPKEALDKLGITVDPDQIGDIKPEDLFTIKDPSQGPHAWAAAAVAVAVFCYPSPTE